MVKRCLKRRSSQAGCCGRDFFGDGERGRAGIRRARDRAADDEVVGSGANRFRRRATRDWSFAAAFAGRTPGTTIRKFRPHARRIARASCADATTPSSPASFASRASARARDPGDPEIPRCEASPHRGWSESSRRAVLGASSFAPAASRAARIIAAPPSVCSVSRRTFGRLAAAATAPATVLGISWNFRSRKIPKPRPASFSTARGPSAVKSWLPTLKRPAAPRSRRARAQAGPRRSTSRATISCDDPRRGVKAPQEAPGGP